MSECGAHSEKGNKLLSFEEDARGADCMLLTVQGKPVRYSGDADVRSLLESRGENSLYANVRINGSVLRRRDFENISLSDGDKVDFLYFMGGGTCSI
ncbi:MAG: sulfur carrier protein ThiS [Thermoleophilia bacterium]|jgi:sulfur carrier protein